jgi:geranylgeranyl pyrophosphate synthase
MDTRSRTESFGEMRRMIDLELARLLEGDSRLFEALRYAVLSGGKRFRPLLLLSSGKAFGGSPASLLPYACALELIHSYSLVHDDLPCMDDDAMRRGRPSCHKVFGEGPALLVGDGLLTLAFEVLAAAPSDAVGVHRKEAACGEISRAAGVRGMIAGQWNDIDLPDSGISAADFLDLIGKKTGALILAAVRAGALLGGADARGLEKMDIYGKNIGLAFQLRDDLLDSKNEKESVDRSRPNAVIVFGEGETRNRIAGAVRDALSALDSAGLPSPELRELAENLLHGEREERHG